MPYKNHTLSFFSTHPSIVEKGGRILMKTQVLGGDDDDDNAAVDSSQLSGCKENNALATSWCRRVGVITTFISDYGL